MNTAKFRDICEAFDVLSQGKKLKGSNLSLVELRAIYDRYGEYGLKEGIVEDGQRVGGGYFLKVTPETVFDRIFNSTDPFAEQTNLNGADIRTSMFSDGLHGQNQDRSAAPNDVIVTVECTLEEFYCGSVKEISYTINKVQHDSRQTKPVHVKKFVQVEPGFSASTVLTFKGEGNQLPKHENANLVIHFTEKTHPAFTRHGNNLIFTEKISLSDCLLGRPVKVRALDGR